MRPDSTFLRFAAACAALSALTTLVVHFGSNFLPPAATFEARVALRTNPLYLAYFWNTILHCLLVVVSMYGVRRLAPHGQAALPDLGFLAFVVFACAEMLRTSLAIFAVNRTWRAAWAATSDEAARERARTLIEGFAGFGEALFFVFFLAFFLGTVAYGLTFFREKGLDGTIGRVFLAWAALNLPGIIETIAGTDHLGPWLEWVVPPFQSAARLLIGWWLWVSAGISSSGTHTASR